MLDKSHEEKHENVYHGRLKEKKVPLSLIYSFNKYILGTNSVSGTLLGAKSMAVSPTKSLLSRRLLPSEKRKTKHR